MKGVVITSSATISPYWFRRIGEIIFLLALMVLALWVNFELLGNPLLLPDIEIKLSVIALAGITAATSLASIIWGRVGTYYYLTLASYLLLSATIAALIATSGHMESPFLAAWVIVAIFAGVFGPWALLALSTGIVADIVYLYGLNYFTQQRIAIYIGAIILPLVLGLIIWHRKSGENEKDKAYNALARELSQVANKSDIVINAIADGVIAIDHKGVIQLINPAGQSLIGWTANDSLGLDYRSVLKIVNDRGESLSEEFDIVQQVLKTNITTTSNEFTIMTNAGKKVLASISVSPVGSLGSGAIIVFRDITADVAEEREQAEFISTASHEMRTPVAAIEGYLGLALNPQTATIDEKAKAYLLKAHESAQHLGRLFQDLLDVSRAEDGRLKSNPQVIDVGAFARDIAFSLTPKASEKGLAMVYKPDIDQIGAQRIVPVFYIHADADHLREVLNNLVENAIKYTKQGDIAVDVTGNDETVSISVSDTGIGIPPEDIPHMFQKFYRVDSTDTREIGGTGLGLYLSRRLTEAMGGHISVESEYGKGSIFRVEFNRLSHEEATGKIENQTLDQPHA